METNNTPTTRQFLDYNGLQILWNKINGTFATKSELNEYKTTIADAIGDINDNIDGQKSLIEANNDAIESIANIVKAGGPKECENYTAAIEIAGTELAIGAVINIKNQSTYNGTEYSAGLYIVTGKGTIKKINTANGDGSIEDVADLVGRLDGIDTAIGNINDAITNEDNGINKRLGTLEDILISMDNMPSFDVQVVDELPTASDEHLNKFYLVSSPDASTGNNIYDEYICVKTKNSDDEDVYKWEKLGTYSLNGSLDNYVTTDAFDSAITAINGNIEKIQNAGYLTVNDVVESITSLEVNTIGAAMSIPERKILELWGESQQ